MDIFLIIIQYVGAISFTISATIYAIHKRADIVGALVFSLLTCFGGGLMRDLILGKFPPNILVDKGYLYLALASVLVCLVIYHLAFIKKIRGFIGKHEHSFIIEFTDAIGLASFVVSGMETAISYAQEGTKQSFLIIVFAGCITGVGGGILRDICSAQIPSVFRKHIYLIPVIVASIFFALVYDKLEAVAIIVAIVFIIAIRILAYKFKWNLPIPKQIPEKEEEKEKELIKK